MLTTTTFGVLQTRVAKRLIDPGSVAVALSDVQQAINDAVTFWKNERFWFNQNRVSLILDPQDPYVLGYGNSNPSYPNAPVLPSDFLFEDNENGFTIPYNNLVYKIKKFPPENFDNQSINGIGLPYCYCFRNGNYEIYYLPNLAYTLTVTYYRDYAALVNNGDNNDFTNYADKLIEYDAIARILSDLRLDDERAAKFAMRVDIEKKNLKSRSGKQAATGYLVVDTLLN